MNIPHGILDQQNDIAQLRRDLHAHPELAFAETRTADLVARQLRSWGLEVFTGIAKTGIVGRLKRGNSQRAIGMRADMDALPILEKNEFAHRSTHEGHMHACGHDGHTAMLLGAARHLAQSDTFDGIAHFIFQPAEEGAGGGREMVREGLFERFPMDAVFGMHNWPGIPVGQFAVMPGPMMASTDNFEIRISGQGGHAAMPQNGIDPVLIGAQVVQALQSIISRNVSPLETAVLSVTQFHAGEVINAIPDEAILRGTVRAFLPQIQDAVEARMKQVASGIASALGGSATVEYQRLYPPTINTPHESELAAGVIEALVGSHNLLRDLKPSTGAEDFAFMLQARPGCYVWIGNGPGDNGCMLHNPKYDFNDAIIPLGTAFWVRLVETLLPQK